MVHFPGPFIEAPATYWQQIELPATSKEQSGDGGGVAAVMIRFPFRPSNDVHWFGLCREGFHAVVIEAE